MGHLWPTRLGVTVVSTVEVEKNFTSMGLSNFTISFLADDIVRLRYVSIGGQLRKMLIVVKMRRSAHSIDMYEYAIRSDGLVLGQTLRGYRRLTGDIPGLWPVEIQQLPGPLGKPARQPVGRRVHAKRKGKPHA